MVRDQKQCETRMHHCTITISHPMDWVLERTVHKGLAGATFGGEVFSDLDYADDVALLAEMLEVLTCILSLLLMQEEARPFGLEINWSKTKIQTTASGPLAHPAGPGGRQCGRRGGLLFHLSWKPG